MRRVVIMRHGESRYNVLNRYAGWLDCDLTDAGIEQARKAGRTLRDMGYSFDVAYTSMLKRAHDTLRLTLEEIGATDVPVHRSWQLNERHFGALDDLTRAEAEARFGQETLRLCRDDFRFRPPPSNGVGGSHSGGLPPGSVVPGSESMHAATNRCIAYWEQVITPSVASGRRALVVAHGDILRLLIGRLLGKKEEEIVRSSVLANASPMVLDLAEDLTVSEHFPIAELERLQ